MSAGLSPGTLVGGRYRIVKRLGVGGMGSVYLANVEGLAGFEKLIALKVAHEHVAHDDTTMRLFLEEARLSARLQHANLGQVHDLGQSDDGYFIAMEYIRGVDLRELIRAVQLQGGRLPLPILLYVVCRLLDGLDYAHSLRDKSGRPLKLVHRDVTPVNCLLSYTGDVKLIDFGIAKAADRAFKTRTGVVRGKLNYMSPEQARGQPLDGRSDLFAVGVILYELLIGERPFDAESDAELMSNVLAGRCRSPRQRDPEVPRALDEVVMRALAVDRTRRYDSAAAMHDALEGCLQGLKVRVGGRELAGFVKLMCPPEEPARADITAETGARQGVGEAMSNAVVPPAPLSAEDPTTSVTGPRPASAAADQRATQRELEAMGGPARSVPGKRR